MSAQDCATSANASGVLMFVLIYNFYKYMKYTRKNIPRPHTHSAGNTIFPTPKKPK